MGDQVSLVCVLGMVMLIVGLICSWNEQKRATAAQIVFLIGIGILFGFGLTTVLGA